MTAPTGDETERDYAPYWDDRRILTLDRLGYDISPLLAAAEAWGREQVIGQLTAAARVAFPSPEFTDADYLRGAADRLEGHYEVGGSNVRATVVRTLRAVADLLSPEGGERNG